MTRRKDYSEISAAFANEGKDQQARDKRKNRLCQVKGIRLMRIKYTEPLTIEYLKDKIRRVQ